MGDGINFIICPLFQTVFNHIGMFWADVPSLSQLIAIPSELYLKNV